MESNLTEILNRNSSLYMEPGWVHMCIILPLGILIIIVNLPVFFVVPKVQSLSATSGPMMISLACTDLAVAGIMLIMTVSIMCLGVEYVVNGVLCSLNGLIIPATMSVSFLTISLFNLDRYLTLKYPLKYQLIMTKSRSKVIIIGIWVISLAIFAFPAFEVGDLRMTYKKHGFQCRPDFLASPYYSILVLSLNMAIPIIVTLFTSVGIIIIVRKHNGFISKQPGSQATHTNKRTNLQIVKTVLIMTASFYIMCLPDNICALVLLFDGGNIHGTLAFLLSHLAVANSVINPLIYIPTIKPYRTAFCNMLHNTTKYR